MKTQTRDKIPLLLDAPLSELTALFLVNAVYFKDKWRLPFKTEHTFAGTFHISKEESVKCDMMMLSDDDTRDIRYGTYAIAKNDLLPLDRSNSLVCELVELPYTGI